MKRDPFFSSSTKKRERHRHKTTDSHNKKTSVDLLDPKFQRLQAKGSRSGDKIKAPAKGSNSGDKMKAPVKGSRSGDKIKAPAKGSRSGDRKVYWSQLFTPVRPHKMPTYDGPYDPAIADKVEEDNKELAARVLRSPVYEMSNQPAEARKGDVWQFYLDQERMVQLRELKVEVAYLQKELATAVKFMDTVELLYRKVLRQFPGQGYFIGTIVAWKKPYFKIKYRDGDVEELSPMEVVKYFVDC